MKARITALLIGAAAATACGSEPIAPPPSPDGGTPTGDASIPDAEVGRLLEGPSIPALAIPLGTADGPLIVLEEDGVLAREDGDAWWIATTTTVNLGPLGRLTGGTSLGDGSALVLADDGARIFTGTRLVPSLIADALAGNPPRRAVRAGDGSLWLASDATLHRFFDGSARQLSPGGLPTTRAELGFGAPVLGQPQTWVASAGRLYALDAASATLEPDAPAGVDAFAIDEGGTLWAEAQARLFVRTPAGRWVDQQQPIEGVGARWIARAEGLAFVAEGQLRAVEGVGAGTRILGTHARGALVRTADGRLLELLPGLQVALRGFEDGATLTASTAVVAYGEGVTLELDGVPIGGVPFRGGLRANIPAGTLDEGAHRLVAHSGTEQAQLGFTTRQGGVPTWTLDIEPFFRERCATCHRAGGNAHDLDGLALWRSEIDRILSAVRERRMPLPPSRALSADEISRIDGWKSAGYPE